MTGVRSNSISNGANEQMKIEQFESKMKSIKNEERVLQETLGTDFFVGPNGKVLPKELEPWIGKNQRGDLLSRVANHLLKNAINQLYRRGSFIGDGGTASIIEFEKTTGLALGRNGGTHEQKGRDMLSYLENKVLSQADLTKEEQELTIRLINDLKRSLSI